MNDEVKKLLEQKEKQLEDSNRMLKAWMCPECGRELKTYLIRGNNTYKVFCVGEHNLFYPGKGTLTELWSPNGGHAWNFILTFE